MYIPKHFEETRPERLHAFVTAHPLGLLVTMDGDGLVANPIPFLLQPERGEHGTLIGHVARANPVWRASRTDVEAMVVFQGAQAYVSPGWVPGKAEHGKVVPTWDYSSVVARGPLVVHDGRDAVLAVVHSLTTHHEGSQRKPWRIADAPADYTERLLSAIVAIEIPLRSLVGKYKLEQHRTAADRLGVESGLKTSPQAAAPALAADMQALREAP
jgi:transcriptional regulator